LRTGDATEYDRLQSLAEHSSISLAKSEEDDLKKIAYLLTAIYFGALSGSMKADTLTFVGSSGSTGPYQMELNGTTSVNLFCLDDFRTIHEGETWDVAIHTGDYYYTTNKSSTNFKYEEEAYIYSMLGKSNGHGHTYTNTDVQQALWYIFDHSADSNHYADDLVDDAFSFSYTKAFLDDFTFYIPTNWPSRYGQPQDMIGSTIPPAHAPEPSTLLLLGSGLVSAAGMVRRRLSGRA
jgi:hypothetical protein